MKKTKTPGKLKTPAQLRIENLERQVCRLDECNQRQGDMLMERDRIIRVANQRVAEVKGERDKAQEAERQSALVLAWSRCWIGRRSISRSRISSYSR
jgi:hypothetical protein